VEEDTKQEDNENKREEESKKIKRKEKRKGILEDKLLFFTASPYLCCLKGPSVHKN
jgi:hypothetical protein